MKWMLAILITLPLAQALDIKVSSLKNSPNMDRSFILKTNLTEKVVLDCQSFIQGLTIGDDLIMMDPQGCEDLYFRIKGSLKKWQKHCLDVEYEVRADFTCSR